jgi:ribonuclease HI
VSRELSHLLAVNVMAYDYAGYGASTGLPSTANTRADISAVLAALQEHHDVAPCHVVLYGQSVGSGPTVGVWWDTCSHRGRGARDVSIRNISCSQQRWRDRRLHCGCFGLSCKHAENAHCQLAPVVWLVGCQGTPC